MKGVIYNEIDRLKEENEFLRKEVIQLAIESIEREKQLAKLEAEILYIKQNVIK